MKETLEEAAENYSKITLNKQGLMSDNQVNGFIAGAKWQQERMYSEEDMIMFAKWLSELSFNVQHFDERGLKPFNELLSIWKKQFKKK